MDSEPIETQTITAPTSEQMLQTDAQGPSTEALLVRFAELQAQVAQKTKALRALGPVLPVPLLLTAQAQQVALALEEVPGVEQRLEQLSDEVAEDPNCSHDMEALRLQWDEYLSELHAMRHSIDQIEPTSHEFHALCDQMLDQLTQANCDLDAIGETGHQRLPDVRAERDEVDALVARVATLRSEQLVRAEQLANELGANAPPELRDLRARLQSVVRELDEFDSRAERSRGALSQSLEQYAALVAQVDSLAEHVAGLSVRHSTTTERDEALPCNLSAVQTQLAKLSEAERAIGEATAKLSADRARGRRAAAPLCYTPEARLRLPIASKVAQLGASLQQLAATVERRKSRLLALEGQLRRLDEATRDLSAWLDLEDGKSSALRSSVSPALLAQPEALERAISSGRQLQLELKAHSQQLDDMEPKLVAIVTLALGSSHEQQQQAGTLAASPRTARLLGQEALTNRHEALRARLSSATLQAGQLLDALAAMGSLREQHEADVADAGATLDRVLRELAELASNPGTSEEFRLSKLRVSHSIKFELLGRAFRGARPSGRTLSLLSPVLMHWRQFSI